MLNIFKVPSYSGKNVYRYIDKLISEGSRVLIVSPYIDAHYASFLIGKSRTRKFFIISSSMDARAKRMLLKGRFPKGPATFASFFYLGFALFRLVGFYSFSAYMLLIAVCATIVALLLRGKPRNIRVKFPKEFVHAKLYISERMAIYGSANLTYKGTHSNVEHVEISYDTDEIAGLERQFWELWKSS